MSKQRLRFRPKVTVASLPGRDTRTGAPQFLNNFADVMGDLNEVFGEREDKRAAVKARERGIIAGRDPEFRRLKGEGIAIESFNAAAIDTFTSRLETRARKEMAERFEKHNQDPRVLQQQFDEYRNGVVSRLPIDMQEAFDLFWAKNTGPLIDKAKDEALRVNRNQQVGALNEWIGERLRGAEMMAFNSTDDLIFEENITGERNDFFAKLIANGPPQAFEVNGVEYPADAARTGVVDPEAIVRQMQQYDRTVMMGRVMGKFDQARKAGEAAEFAREWIDNPLEGFTTEERAKITASMKAAITADEAINKRVNDEAKAAEEVQRSRRVGDLKRRVAAGTATEEDIEKAFPQDISGAERSQLLIQLDKQRAEQSEALDLENMVSFAITSGIPLDADSPQHRKAVDAYFKKRFGEKPPNAETMTEIVDFIRDVAVIPTVTRSAIRSMARSANPDQAVMAADMVARIEKAAPQVLETMPKDEKAFSLLVSSMVASGTEPANAVELARLRVYETPASEMEQLRKVFTEKGFDDDNLEALNDMIDDHFDPLFRLQPTAPPSMVGEYNTLVDTYYIRTRDEQIARELAGRDLRRVWGVSDTVGTPFAGEAGEEQRGRLQMVKYPPEKANGRDGKDNRFMRPQLERDAIAIGKSVKVKVDPETVHLRIDDRTAREKNRSWQIWHINKDGQPVPLQNPITGRPARWRPNFETSPEGKEMIASRKLRKSRSQKVHLERIEIMKDGTVAEQLFGLPAAKRTK